MSKEFNEALEVTEENENYRETLYVLKSEIARIRKEYFLGAKSMGETALEEIDAELETITLTIENVLY